jgi:N-methylhydantoinase A
MGLREDNAGRFDALLAEVTETALGQFEAEGVTPDQVRFVRFAKMRYENQEHSVEILLPEGAIEPSSVEGIASSFHAGKIVTAPGVSSTCTNSPDARRSL